MYLKFRVFVFDIEIQRPGAAHNFVSPSIMIHIRCMLQEQSPLRQLIAVSIRLLSEILDILLVTPRARYRRWICPRQRSMRRQSVNLRDTIASIKAFQPQFEDSGLLRRKEETGAPWRGDRPTTCKSWISIRNFPYELVLAMCAKSGERVAYHTTLPECRDSS